MEDALASRFRRSESLDSLLFPEPMLFLSLMWMLQLELGPVGHEVVRALTDQGEQVTAQFLRFLLGLLRFLLSAGLLAPR